MNGVTLTACQLSLLDVRLVRQPPDPPAPALVWQPPPPAQPPDPPGQAASFSSLFVTFWIPFSWINFLLTDVLALAGQWRGNQQALILN